MRYFMTGTIFECIPKQYTNKSNGEITKEFVEVTVEQVTTDANGFRVKDVEKVNFDQEHYQTLKNAIDKFIVIPMEHRTWRDANSKQMQSTMMMSEGATFTIFDKNPLEQKELKKSA